MSIVTEKVHCYGGLARYWRRKSLSVLLRTERTRPSHYSRADAPRRSCKECEPRWQKGNRDSGGRC